MALFHPTQHQRICPNCKKPLKTSMIICAHCGTAIIKQPVFFNYLFYSFLVSAILFAAGYFFVFPNIRLTSEPLSEFGMNLAVLFVAIWELTFIVFKFIDYTVQKRALEEFRKRDISGLFLDRKGIHLNEVEKLLAKVFNILQGKGFYNILGLIAFERIRKTLYYLKAVPSREEIGATLSYQAEIDHGQLDVEFRPVKVFNWALPTMGFFGTVLGMGKAIREFSGFLSKAGEELAVESIKNNLTEVVSGLGLAFDSTMLALLFLLILLPLGAYLENQYRSLLNQIEEYSLTFITPNLVFDEDKNRPGL